MITPTSCTQMFPQKPQNKAAFASSAAGKPSGRFLQTQPARPALPLTGVPLRTFQMFPEWGQQQLFSLVPCEGSSHISPLAASDCFVLFVGAGELAAKTELLWSRRAVRISQAYQHSRCAVCEWLFHILFADLFDLYFSFQLALRESRGRRLRLSASRLANSFCHSAICTLTSAMISFRLHLFTEAGRKEGKDGQLEGSFLEWILFLWPCGTQGTRLTRQVGGKNL